MDVSAAAQDTGTAITEEPQLARQVGSLHESDPAGIWPERLGVFGDLLTPVEAAQYRKQLAQEGLIKLHRVLTGRRGGQLQVTEVTQEGYRLLDQYGVYADHPLGRGAFEHRLWRNVVHAWAVRQGYPSQAEQDVAGKAVDVGVVWEERRVAVEIVFEGLAKELGNLVKDLERGWDQIVFCAVKKDTLERLRQMVLETFGEDLVSRDRARFVRLCDFLEKSNPNGGTAGSATRAEQ